jgi:ATP-dependent Clp protease ATP-binding subunit ClpA
LTNAVAEKPFSVLLFDEIEKAHPRVLDKFLQIIDDGRLTDGRGQTVHFSETVIIFTSNIGAGQAKPKMKRDEVKAHFMEAVRSHFNDTLGRPELLNRFGDNIIVFDFINDPEIRSQILEAKLKGVREHLEENFNLALQIGEKDIQRLVAKGNLGHGGRGLINVIEREIVNPMSRYIFEHLHQIGEQRLTLNINFDKSGAKFTLKK